MKGGLLVPAEPIRKVLQTWMDQTGFTVWQAATRTGLSEKTMFRLLEGKQEKVSMAAADLLITKTVGPWHWWGNEELQGIYSQANLSKLDIVLPLENEGAKEHARKRLIHAYETCPSKTAAARSLGMDLCTFSRRLDQALVEVGREPATVPMPQKTREATRRTEAYIEKYTRQNAKKKAAGA